MTAENKISDSSSQEKAIPPEYQDDEFVHSAILKATWYRRWGLFTWSAYTALSAISLVVSIAVPFGLAAFLYLPRESMVSWNLSLLWLSAIAAACQILVHVLRLRERAFRGRRLGAVLEGAVLKFRNGLLTKESLIETMASAYVEEIEEEGP